MTAIIVLIFHAPGTSDSVFVVFWAIYVFFLSSKFSITFDIIQ